MEIFVYFFLVFILVAVGMAYLTKKTFIFCMGSMLMLAAVVIVAWSCAIDDGSRRGMEAVVLVIMWSIAAGSFLIGFILFKIGLSQNRKKALASESIIKTEETE